MLHLVHVAAANWAHHYVYSVEAKELRVSTRYLKKLGHHSWQYDSFRKYYFIAVCRTVRRSIKLDSVLLPATHEWLFRATLYEQQ